MDHGHAGRVEEVESEVPVAADIHAVAGDTREAKIGGDGFAVEGKAATGERARAERQNVGPAPRLAEALEVPREHLEIRQQIMRPEDGLRAAKVSIAGNHGI